MSSIPIEEEKKLSIPTPQEPPLDKFANDAEYVTKFVPLLELEVKAEMNNVKKQVLTQMTIQVSIANRRVIVSFQIPQPCPTPFSVHSGGILRIAFGNQAKSNPSLEFNIKSVSPIGYVRCSPRDPARCLVPGVYQGCRITTVYNDVTFRRCKDALKSKSAMNPVLESLLFGSEHLPALTHTHADYASVQPHAAFPKLNSLQKEAILNAIKQPLCIIQGPPGTGKTYTSAALVHHLWMKQKSRPGVNFNREKILTCATSNEAADKLADAISKTGLKVVRVLSHTRETDDTCIHSPHALHTMLMDQLMVRDPDVYALQQARLEGTRLPRKEYRKVVKVMESVVDRILDPVQVICTTCCNSVDKRLDRLKYYSVVIDEAAHATEPLIRIALTRPGIQHVALVGDQKQLGPVVKSKKAGSQGLARTLFERMILNGNPYIMMKEQYRMHPFLAELPSQEFYNNELVSGVTPRDRLSTFPLIHTRYPTFYFDHRHEPTKVGTSYENQLEAVMVVDFVSKLLMNYNYKPNQITVITPYLAQESRLAGMIFTQLRHVDGIEDMEITTVDSYQGKENELVILSCTKTKVDEQRGEGFLNQPRRLNVAITRAKCRFFIFGDAVNMARANSHGKNLVDRYKQYQLLGDYHDFKFVGH